MEGLQLYGIKSFDLKSSSFFNSTITTSLFSKEPGKAFALVNIYLPFTQRKDSWEELFTDASFLRTDVICGGNLMIE